LNCLKRASVETFERLLRDPKMTPTRAKNC